MFRDANIANGRRDRLWQPRYCSAQATNEGTNEPLREAESERREIVPPFRQRAESSTTGLDVFLQVLRVALVVVKRLAGFWQYVDRLLFEPPVDKPMSCLRG